MNDLIASLEAEIERAHRLASERLELIQELEEEIVELKLDLARADEAAIDAGARSAEETALLLAARAYRRRMADADGDNADLYLAARTNLHRTALAYARSLEAPDA